MQAIALSGLLLTLTASAFADASSDARKAITAIYQRQVTALEHKDSKGAFSHLAPDYVHIDLKGHQTTAAAERTDADSLFSMAKSIHATTTITAFSLKANLAQATVKVSGTIVLLNPKTQKMVTLVDTTVSNDTWMKTKSSWHLKRTQDISEKATVDGKPYSGN